MILGELLRNSDFFKEEKEYLTVGSKILRYMGERNTLVKKTVIELQPVLARSPHFVKHFLNPVCKFILDCLNKNRAELKTTCYQALGDLAMEVKDAIRDYLAQIVYHIKDGLTGKTKNHDIVEACQKCMSKLACSVGTLLEPLLNEDNLIDPLFADGLSATLVSTLRKMAFHIPDDDQCGRQKSSHGTLLQTDEARVSQYQQWTRST